MWDFFPFVLVQANRISNFLPSAIVVAERLMFSQASVILSTAEACMAKEGMCGKEGACMAKWGMSGERSMYGEGGHVWCGRGHA